MYLKSLFLIIISISIGSTQNLDSLITSSTRQVQHYKMMPLIPPEELFAKKDTVSVAHILSPLHISQPSMAEQLRISELDKRVRDLELNVTKVSVILDNMQKVNEKHSDKFDTIMRFLEAIITAIAGVITALIGVYFKKRKN